MEIITITSIFLSMKYSICLICSSTSPFAFCTLTLAPSSVALLTNKSLSRCQRSITRESMERPISTLSLSSTVWLIVSSCLPQPAGPIIIPVSITAANSIIIIFFLNFHPYISVSFLPYPYTPLESFPYSF